MRDLGLNIISTEKDFDLFTNDVYYKKVKKALANVKKEYKIKKEYYIACYNNYISLYDNNKHLMMIREI